MEPTLATPQLSPRAAPRPSPLRRAQLYAELWTSLAALVRSYTALHGLHRGRAAAVEHSDQTIRARHGERQLILTRHHHRITWMRENGSGGTLRLTRAGALYAAGVEQAMDLAAGNWARELMQ